MAKLWTKRSVLSTVATIFDPNGWIAPVIFWAKYFLQRLWIAEISWDKPITGDLLTDWLGFLNRLESITQVSIPRHFLPSGKYKASLHGFCDASVSGYATVVYLRTVKRDGTAAVHLVTAKSKVAPLRTRLSIPKLELSGAALLTRLLNHVISTLGKLIELSEVYAWSDSQIVLAWLQASPHRLEVFVANQVSQIQASEVKLIWRHVPGELNPADVASRVCDAPPLVDHPLWWGPKWLADPVSTWPPTSLHGTESLPGIRIAAVETEATPSDPLLARIMSFPQYPILNVEDISRIPAADEHREPANSHENLIEDDNPITNPFYYAQDRERWYSEVAAKVCEESRTNTQKEL
ncbi:unnamed protein product [Arctia plantaginis]|uniref:Uncharacterized protein n=1 Tax=Arctia plantaginis TaxID=874455 RepID=A0A8S1AR68_ARCPL|nr:unnamed protein product [Arctia plantaginis]